MPCHLARPLLLNQFTLLSSEKPGLVATNSLCDLGESFGVSILLTLNLKVVPLVLVG